MSGPRPLHLSRRGAVYVVRFTLPRDLNARLSGMEIRKSLLTKDIDEARAKCLDAEIWFQHLLSRLRTMDNPSRKDVEFAANLFFNRLKEAVDVPRDFLSLNLDDEIGFNIVESRRRIAQIDEQLLVNTFDGMVAENARQLLSEIQLGLSELDKTLTMLAMQLAAKAEREQMRYLIHQLSEPEKSFRVDDKVFADNVHLHTPLLSSIGSDVDDHGTLTLSELVDRHKAGMTDLGIGESNLTEFSRVANWLLEEVGPELLISSVTTPQLRDFRDKLKRRNKKRQGINGPLASHLTDDRDNQIMSATARRYWGYVQAIFRSGVSEGYLSADPAASLKIILRKNEESQVKEPFSNEEVWKYFHTPLFAGYQSKSRRLDPGQCYTRDGHWWSGLIPVFTGMRASEVSQLLLNDFEFDHAIPHILVRPEDESGKKTKTTKNNSFNRAIPIAPEMLELGIREFIEQRRVAHPNKRIFSELPLGTSGRKSLGMSKFWGRYFRKFGLHKPGRGTHIWRHTIIYRLRAAGVAQEDITYLVGHSSESQTAAYGAGQLLERVLDRCLRKLDYGFKIVDVVGGPYDAKQHKA